MSPKPEPAASLSRRAAALLYEALLVLALVFFAAFAYRDAAATVLSGWQRHAFQLYLFLVVGLYFVICWTRGGQTLPMKTWRLKLVSAQGAPVSMPRALARYVLAWLSVLGIGLGFVWAAFDREHQFLHDRLAGTKIVTL